MAGMNLQMNFKTNTAEFVNELRRTGDAVKDISRQMEKAFGAVNNALGAIGVGLSVGAIFTKMIDEAKQAEDASNRINQVLRSTGGVAGVTAQQVDKIAGSLSKLTGIDDDAIKGGQALLLTFKNIGKDAFEPATRAMLDMSAAMGTDMKSSAIQLGKALNDPTQGISALTRVGVTFTDSQKAMIKKLQESGDLLGAQTIILKELESEFGNMSIAARDSLGGAFQALQTSVDNLFEAFGTKGSDGLRYALELTITAVQHLTDYVPTVTSAFAEFGKMLAPVTNVMGDFFKTGTNLFIAWQKTLLDGFGFIGVAVEEFFKGQMNPQKAQAMLADFSSGLLQNFKTDFVGNALKEVEKLDKETKTRMKGLAEAHAKANALAKPQGESGPSKEEEKQAKRHEQAVKSLNQMLASLESQLEKTRALTDLDQKRALQIEAAEKVSRMENLTIAEKAAATKKVYELLLKQKEIESEKDQKGKITTLKEQTEALRAQAAGLTQQYEAQKKIRDIMADPFLSPEKKKEFVAATEAEVAAQEQLKNVMEQQKEILSKVSDGNVEYVDRIDMVKNALQDGILTMNQYREAMQKLNQERQKDLKVQDAKIDKMREETERLQYQAEGREKEYDLLKKIRDINSDKYLTGEEKSKYIELLKQESYTQDQVTDRMAKQKDILSKMGDSTLAYRDKLNMLNEAQQKGILNSKQYGDALQKLRDDQIKKVTESVKDFASKTLNSFGQAIANGEKLSTVFKNMGKQLALLAAQKLLFDPISNALGNFAGKLYGGGSGGSTGGSSAGGLMAGGLGGLLGGLFGKKGTGSAPIAGLGQGPTVSGSSSGFLPTGGLAGPINAGGVNTPAWIWQFAQMAPGGWAFRTIDQISWENPSQPAPEKKSTISDGSHPSVSQGITAAELAALARPLISSNSAGPAWNVTNPDCCPPGGGGGGSPGLMGGGGLAPMISMPQGFDNSANEAARAAHFAQANAAQMKVMGSGAANAGNTFLGSGATGATATNLYLRNLANQSNQQMNAYYQAGQASYGQVQNLQGAWSNALSTQAAMGYSATPNWLKGLNGGNFQFAGGTGIIGTQLNVEPESTFTPGLTGAISGKPMYGNVGSGGTQSYQWAAGPPRPANGGVARFAGGFVPGYAGFTNSSGVPAPGGGTDWVEDGAPGYTFGGGGIKPFDMSKVPGANNPLAATAARWGMNTRAKGGELEPGIPTIVGEEGREMIIPQRPGNVVPHPTLMKMIEGASSGGKAAAPQVQIVNNGSPVSVSHQEWDGQKLVMTLENLITNTQKAASSQALRTG